MPEGENISRLEERTFSDIKGFEPFMLSSLTGNKGCLIKHICTRYNLRGETRFQLWGILNDGVDKPNMKYADLNRIAEENYYCHVMTIIAFPFS